jgi:hypothetical protein
MITIEYNPDSGIPLTDGSVDRCFSIALKTDAIRDMEYVFATENIIHRFRLGIVRGELSNWDVRFVYRGYEFYLDQYAQLFDWPDGFADQHANTNELILKLIFNIKEE